MVAMRRIHQAAVVVLIITISLYALAVDCSISVSRMKEILAGMKVNYYDYTIVYYA